MGILYYATAEVWVPNEAGHRVPITLLGYGDSQQAAKDDAAFRTGRWTEASAEERNRLRFAPYRLIDAAAGGEGSRSRNKGNDTTLI